MFRFPSLQTGKCIASTTILYILLNRTLVSIPFKRESVYSKQSGAGGVGGGTDVFRFPSNGKVYSKFKVSDTHNPLLLIPSFDSLQTGKCIASSFVGSLAKSIARFNSLQTGKCIASFPGWLAIVEHKSFDSLQTGKCIARSVTRTTAMRTTSFDSLQTGKCIASVRVRRITLFCSTVWVSIPFKRESV